MKILFFLILTLLAVSYGSQQKPRFAELYIASNQSLAIEDHWLVVFYPNTSVELRENHMKTLASHLDVEYESIGNTWNIDNSFLGYHGVFTRRNVHHIRSDPIVQHVEQDSIVKIEQSGCTTQSNAVWNLHRLVANTVVNGNGNFSYDATGTGATIYILDTGILLTHVDFTGRATFELCR